MTISSKQHEYVERHSKIESGRLEKVDGTNIVDTIHLERYTFATRYTQGCTVLDIACGIGYGSFLVAETGQPASVTGVDVSPAAVAEAQSKYHRDNLKYLKISPEQIPFPDQTFDRIISFETIEHTVDPTAFLQELKRVLKTDGLLIISTPNRRYHSFGKSSPWNPHHTVEYYPHEFKSVLTGVFPKIEFWGGQEFLPLAWKPTLKYNWVEFKFYNLKGDGMLAKLYRSLKGIAIAVMPSLDPAKKKQAGQLNAEAQAELKHTRADVVPWVEQREPYTFVAVCRK